MFVDEAEQPTHPLKRVLIVLLVALGLLIPICSLLFTTAEIPQELSPSNPTHQIRKAVVTRWFFDSRLKPGDLVLVELKGTPREFAVRKLQEIVPPDPATRRIATSERARMPGSRTYSGTPNRAAIQAIYDMDYGPTYRVASDTGGNHVTELHHTRIVGKVMWTYGSKRKGKKWSGR